MLKARFTTKYTAQIIYVQDIEGYESTVIFNINST
jgi:hypothetical protein